MNNYKFPLILFVISNNTYFRKSFIIQCTLHVHTKYLLILVFPNIASKLLYI